jgi:hypothetical protein
MGEVEATVNPYAVLFDLLILLGTDGPLAGLGNLVHPSPKLCKRERWCLLIILLTLVYY